MANFLKKVGRRMERDLGIRNRGGIINKGNGGYILGTDQIEIVETTDEAI